MGLAIPRNVPLKSEVSVEDPKYAMPSSNPFYKKLSHLLIAFSYDFHYFWTHFRVICVVLLDQLLNTWPTDGAGHTLKHFSRIRGRACVCVVKLALCNRAVWSRNSLYQLCSNIFVHCNLSEWAAIHLQWSVHVVLHDLFCHTRKFSVLNNMFPTRPLAAIFISSSLSTRWIRLFFVSS